MSFNTELLRHRAGEIRENVALLREAAAWNLDKFLSDKDKQDASMFRLLIAIEAAQSICTHLAARIPTRTPDSMGECFEGLKNAGLYGEDLCQALCRMARFRNLLVHRYWKIDLREVHSFLNQNLGDFEEYLEALKVYLGGDL